MPSCRVARLAPWDLPGYTSNGCKSEQFGCRRPPPRRQRPGTVPKRAGRKPTVIPRSAHTLAKQDLPAPHLVNEGQSLSPWRGHPTSSGHACSRTDAQSGRHGNAFRGRVKPGCAQVRCGAATLVVALVCYAGREVGRVAQGAESCRLLQTIRGSARQATYVKASGARQRDP